MVNFNKIPKVKVKVLLVIFLSINLKSVQSFRTHWWNPDNPNPNYNNPNNQIGPYQDVGDNYHRDHNAHGSNDGHGGHDAFAYDSRIPKDIMVDVINNMGLALLEAHNEHNDNNIAISPYGATSILIALLEGLVGEAAYEIKIATQLPPDLSVIRIGLRDIHRHLKSYFIPKEGFLAGLTLSHDNITLTREYQAILKFYGYDIESFNNPVYPDIYSSTSDRPAVTMTTGKMKTTQTTKTTKTTDATEITTNKMDDTTITTMTSTTQSPETTTMESISTIIEKLSSTLAMDETTFTTEDANSNIQTTTEALKEELNVSTTKRPKTTKKRRRKTTTTEMPETTKLPSPSDEDVEGTTTKKLPTRSYTTEAIDVTGPEGRTETFYSMTTLKSGEGDSTTEGRDEFKSTTDRSNLKSSESEGSEEGEQREETEQSQSSEEVTDFSTIRIPVTDGVTAISSFKTTEGTFFEATTYIPGRFSTFTTPGDGGGGDLISETGSPTLSDFLRTKNEEQTTENEIFASTLRGSTLKSDFIDGTTFFPMDSTSTFASLESSTMSPNSEKLIPTTDFKEITTKSDEFVTLTERDNEIFSELNQKLTKFDLTTTISPIPISEITFTTSEPLTAYTQTQNTEATSLEDRILVERNAENKNSSFFEIAANILTRNTHENARISNSMRIKNAPRNIKSVRKVSRRKRSVIDYLIARYYDDYYINNNRRYVPPSTARTHYSNYQPEEPYTFLVNGKHRETNISFMTYDTILPFYYVRALDAMALSFPLDSSMYYLLLVLPLDPHGIDKLVHDMRKATSLRHIVDKLEYTHVKAVIPSFMLKGYVVLTPTLQKLCIRKIFEPRHANFSPMTPERNLYVTNIEQAVTVTIRNYIDPASHSARNLNHYRPVEFRADHPFLYFVMDSQLHVNLMAGKIINPLNSRIR